MTVKMHVRCDDRWAIQILNSLTNLTSSSSASLTWDVGITVEHNILQALTNSFQHCTCLSGRIPFNAKVENTTAQFLNWSAVKPLKFDAILDGIWPILDGTFNLMIPLWRWLNSFSLSKFSSFQILSIFLVVPNIKLCMGWITTNEIKSK